MGTPDAYLASCLGVHLDIFKQMKNDPRLVKCLDVLDDIYIRSRYMEEEQDADAEIYQVSKEELIASRRDELVNLQALVRKNAAALEKEYTKKRKQPVRTTKGARDADMTSFIPFDASQAIRKPRSKAPLEKQSVPAQQTAPVSRETQLQMEKAQLRQSYDHLLSFRADSRKILGAEIKPVPGDEGWNRFYVKLTREQGFVDERPDCSILAFGLSELREIGLALKDKKPLSKAELAFFKRTKSRYERKKQMEIALGLRQPSPTASPKRKATTEASGHVVKK